MQLANSGPCAHLWIVLTDPFPDTGEVVLVSVSTLRNAVDQTVLLQQGDHPYIRWQSSVFYGDLRLVEAKWVDESMDSGKAKQNARCSEGLLRLIQDGIFASDFTAPKMEALCRLHLRRSGRLSH